MNCRDISEVLPNKVTLSDDQKQQAVEEMISMTDITEKEAAAEALLASKGFTDSVVSLSKDSADVVVNASKSSDGNRAQIEDIITRKNLCCCRKHCNHSRIFRRKIVDEKRDENSSKWIEKHLSIHKSYVIIKNAVRRLKKR